MISRRDFIQLAAATAAMLPAGWSRALAQQRLTQAELLALRRRSATSRWCMSPTSTASCVPLLFREPSINLGVGEAKGLVPHITGRALLDLYKIPAGSAAAYALGSDDFAALAQEPTAGSAGSTGSRPS